MNREALTGSFTPEINNASKARIDAVTASINHFLLGDKAVRTYEIPMHEKLYTAVFNALNEKDQARVDAKQIIKKYVFSIIDHGDAQNTLQLFRTFGKTDKTLSIQTLVPLTAKPDDLKKAFFNISPLVSNAAAK